MNTLIALLKKEWMEQVRTQRAVLLGIVFILLGIMNPAVAKLTPWMLEMMADAMADAGMSVTSVTVDAMTSWQQFFKNLPIGLIVFVLVQSGCFTAEYQRGTLIPVVTRGVAKCKVVTAKTAVLMLLWSVCYWGCFGITYAYNAYFWDNGIAKHLLLAAALCWLFGVMVIAAMVFFSTLLRTASGVMLGTAAVWYVPYAFAFLPTVSKYLPTALADGMPLLGGMKEAGEYLGAALITCGLTLVFLLASYPLMNRKQL
jgi:ABC-2 type transport system permease protein